MTKDQRIAKIEEILRDQYDLAHDCPADVVSDLIADALHFVDHVAERHLHLHNNPVTHESVIAQAMRAHAGDNDEEDA